MVWRGTQGEVQGKIVLEKSLKVFEMCYNEDMEIKNEQIKLPKRCKSIDVHLKGISRQIV